MKCLAIGIVVFMILNELYKIYRFNIYFDFAPSDVYETYDNYIIIFLAVIVLDSIILILIVISSVKCIKNFGKGIKEILIKQAQANESNTQLTEV
jgi:hypothetical protein